MPSPIHEVVLDLTGAASTDEVLERMIASIEDLQGTVHLRLHGRPAPDVEVCDEELTSWSTERLAIVLAPRPAAAPAPAPAPAVEHRTTVALPPRSGRPPAEVVREVTAAHDAWRGALASLRRHDRAEPPAVARPDLGGLTLDAVAAHLEALQARVPDPAPHASATEEPHTAEPPVRREPRARAVARVVAALVTVCAGTGLLLLAETLMQRVLPAIAIVIAVGLVLTARRGPVEDDPDLDGPDARARAALLAHMEASAELARARHAATTALQDAGLPTDPDALTALVDAGREVGLRQAARADWDRRRADLAARLVEATTHLRAALRRGGVEDTLDVEAAWACFRARADWPPRPSPHEPVPAYRSRHVGDHHPASARTIRY